MCTNQIDQFRSLIDLVSPFVEIVEKPKTAQERQAVRFRFVGRIGLEPTTRSCKGYILEGLMIKSQRGQRQSLVSVSIISIVSTYGGQKCL